MALIEWTEKLSVNIATIDKQHQKLVAMLNEFYDEVTKKSNKELIADLISKMKEYTQIHFRTEEELFAKYSYKDAGAHIQKHNEFIKKVNDLENRFSAGKLVLSFEITNFLKDWLVSHIQQSDKEYAAIINRLN